MINQVRAFTPSREDPERLDARTAGRSGVLTSVARALRATASSANRSHVLLIGPRGAGKSHVVEVALRRLHAEAKHDEQVRVARLPEDAIGIASAADVLVEVIRSLDAPSEVHQAALAARRDGRQVDLESAIHHLLDGKALVLVVENLDRVMVAIGEPGQHDLRAWVERSGEVMVFATAPLLFQAVQTRASPWFGSFEVIHLQPLTLDEGSELVEHLAREFGDGRLAAFVRTAQGQSRLAAIHHLAGGSPRIWTIFASCVDLEQLDRLVPAAEALLEELVPFYQQRLWELPATEQKVLDVLARTAPSATVTQIAEAAGVQRDTTASTLGRLAEAGWVRRRKAPATDRRESWYELAEPLLRHHLQYRDSRGDELRLIVELLQAWFDRSERRDLLAASARSSMREAYLASTLQMEPGRRFDDAYADRDITALAAEARLWALGKTVSTIGSVTLGNLLVQIVEAVPNDVPRSRQERIIGAQLAKAALPPSDPASHALRMITICWNGSHDPARAAHSLDELLRTKLPKKTREAVRAEHAFWLGESGNCADALAQFEAVIADQTVTLGPTHHSTLTSRHNHAYLLGESGNPAGALTEFEAVIADQTDTLGPTHHSTLTSRHSHASWLWRSGNPTDALTELEAVIADQTDTLGPTHPDTLTSRANHAHLLGASGNHTEALTAYRGIVKDLDSTPGQDAESRASVLIAAASLVVRGGLLRTTSTPTSGQDPLHLLWLVGMEADARAYASLPVEVRGLLDPDQ